MLYIIYAESANYAGYGQHFVVEASNELEAEELASLRMEDHFCEEDEAQLEEDGIYMDVEVYSSMESIEPFDESHEFWKYYQDPKQAQFYIKVNF